jgi:gliding motility-associated-like protein
MLFLDHNCFCNSANMPLIKPKFFFSILLLLITMRTAAQKCEGSLGDPVINETFGIGSTYSPIGPPLKEGITNLRYTGVPCPADGQYTIASSTNGCFGGTWHVRYGDHTGTNLNGYMMVINASLTPNTFYVQKAEGSKMCPNATYEFAAWILNVLVKSPITEGYVEPNITYSIETVDGRVLKTYKTGNIPASETADWHQYGTLFTTPADGADIVVKLTNNATGGNGNDLILDDITFKPCGPVIKTGFDSPTETTDHNLCVGDNANYHLTSSQNGYASPVYQWQVNRNDGKDWVNIAGAVTDSYDPVFTNATEGKYQYRVGILATQGAALSCRIYSQPLTVNVYPIPTYKQQALTTVCENGILTLFANGGREYEWTGPNGFTSTEISPTVSRSATKALEGTYTIKVTSNGCSTTTSTQVQVFPAINPAVGGDKEVCAGSAVQLQASGGTIYKWTPSTGLDHNDVAQPMASPAVTTEYDVEIGNGGCSVHRTVTVKVLKLPVADAGTDLTMQEGDLVRLNGKAGGDNVTYYWTPTETLIAPTSLTPAINPTESTTYTLHVESQENCGTVTDDVFVRVYKKITIPNTFTPNNDGINDTWVIDKLDTYPEATVKIYTREGKPVYQGMGGGKPWRGDYKGNLLTTGTYYYVIDLKNNTPPRSGWVLLIR